MYLPIVIRTIKSASRQMYLFPDAPESIRWCPWSRLDCLHDEPQATAGFTESDVPSFLITYIKV